MKGFHVKRVKTSFWAGFYFLVNFLLIYVMLFREDKVQINKNNCDN